MKIMLPKMSVAHTIERQQNMNWTLGGPRPWPYNVNGRGRCAVSASGAFRNLPSATAEAAVKLAVDMLQ